MASRTATEALAIAEQRQAQIRFEAAKRQFEASTGAGRLNDPRGQELADRPPPPRIPPGTARFVIAFPHVNAPTEELALPIPLTHEDIERFPRHQLAGLARILHEFNWLEFNPEHVETHTERRVDMLALQVTTLYHDPLLGDLHTTRMIDDDYATNPEAAQFIARSDFEAIQEHRTQTLAELMAHVDALEERYRD